MASIRRKNGSKFWYACFTLPGGRRTQRSTDTTDRKTALNLANVFEDAARKEKTESQVRTVLSDVHETIHGSPISAATLDDYYAQWIERKEREVAKNTLAAYRYAVPSFASFLPQKRTRPLQYITPTDVAKWRDKLAAESSAVTANNKLKILRAFFESAWRLNLIQDNPASKVSVLKVSPSQRRPFQLAELKAVLAASTGEWKTMILMAAYTGQRLKDIASLTLGQVDLEHSELRFATSKTGRNQVIPLHAVLQRELNSAITSTDFNSPLFPAAYGVAVTNTDVSPLSQQFHQILVRAGLASARIKNGKSRGVGRKAPRQQNPLTFHSLRHTATSWLKEAGVPESVARDIIGHDSAEISRLYTHTGERAKRAAVDLLPDLLSVSPKPPTPTKSRNPKAISKVIAFQSGVSKSDAA
jgi:integrase